MVVTYNGDFFDWPYVDTRCNKYQMNLYHTLGIRGTGEGTEQILAVRGFIVMAFS